MITTRSRRQVRNLRDSSEASLLLTLKDPHELWALLHCDAAASTASPQLRCYSIHTVLVCLRLNCSHRAGICNVLFFSPYAGGKRLHVKGETLTPSRNFRYHSHQETVSTERARAVSTMNSEEYPLRPRPFRANTALQQSAAASCGRLHGLSTRTKV
jgi:hypothetical protein